MSARLGWAGNLFKNRLSFWTSVCSKGNFVRMRAAFKEWAVVVDALGRGEQIIILRKGGIAEEQGEFQVAQSRFLLFPTLFHQQREGVIPAAQARFEEMARGFPPRDILRLEYWAEVIFSRKITSLEEALSLRGLHIWSDEIIAQRFDWGGNLSNFVLGVRVFRLPGRIEVPMLESYGGCKSWVELETDVATNQAAPVLSDASFKFKLDQCRTALNLQEEPAWAVSGPV